MYITHSRQPDALRRTRRAHTYMLVGVAGLVACAIITAVLIALRANVATPLTDILVVADLVVGFVGIMALVSQSPRKRVKEDIQEGHTVNVPVAFMMRYVCDNRRRSTNWDSDELFTLYRHLLTSWRTCRDEFRENKQRGQAAAQ